MKIILAYFAAELKSQFIKMKYLIAGLGNIGVEYENTRHNIGFRVLDSLAKAENINFTSGRYASVGEYKLKGRQLILIKPSTYMNLSGKAVNYWMQKENIPIENVLIICDDLALNFGSIRIKAKGSDGGHNGLTHIIETFGHQNFARMRFGIGNGFHRGGQIDFVLGKWTEEENAKLDERCEKMVEAIKSFVTIGLERTMNFYNGK